jgi:hypothetical protein
MKNRFVHYKIHSIELLWWFQSNQCRSNAIENITNRILLYPTSVWGDAEIVLNVAILRPSCYFFLRKIHFAISTAQKTILDDSRVSINSYNESGWVLKITLKRNIDNHQLEKDS